ncbi:MAG: tRNA (guanine(46)-N(7))-methyltransferase TrmB [Alphaproteobacteria bacterium]
MTHPLIRSYGRIIAKPLSDAKKEILEKIYPLISLPDESPLNLSTLFPKSVQKFCLDIGFGGGENLIDKIKKNPTIGYIGCEVFLNGMIQFIRHWQESNSPKNCRVSTKDVREVIKILPKNSLDFIDLFYPDPWHKARHHKRRMISKDNLNLLTDSLKKKGILRIASDIPNYIEMAIENINNHSLLELTYSSEKPYSDWETTRYEQKAFREGRTPHYLSVVKF